MIEASIDTELVIKAQAGDRTAFGELVHLYQRDVFRRARSNVSRPEEAEDIAQETFERAFKSLHQLRKPGRFPQWLGRIARNTSIDWLRRQGELQAMLLPEDVHEPTLVYDMEEHCLPQLWEGIEHLSGVNRQAVLMHYFEGRTYEEMSEALGVPSSTVRSRLQEARQKLRDLLKPIGPPVLREAFADSGPHIPERWQLRRPLAQEDARRYEVVNVQGSGALKLAEFAGHSAHVWIPVSAEAFVASFDVMGTQQDAIWYAAAHTEPLPSRFVDNGLLVFGLHYWQWDFQLRGGQQRNGATRLLDTNARLSFLEDGSFHHYQISRRAGQIKVRRDGQLILSGQDLSNGQPIQAIQLSGTGHLQGDNVGAYFANVMVRAL